MRADSADHEKDREALGRSRGRGSTVTEVEGASHFVMVSQPGIVAGVIREAVMACAANPVA